MRVVVLTNGSSHGAEILSALSSRKIVIAAIIVQQSNQNALAKIRSSVRRYGFIQTAFDVCRHVWGRLTAKSEAPIEFERFSERIYRLSNPNGPECIELLKTLSTDLLVLAGAPILKSDVIQTIKVAVLNAHPGLLPKYRGVDVISWALLNGDPIGVTIHRVDAGIDTGNIVLQESVTVAKGDTMASLRHKAEILAGRLMGEVVSQAISSGVVECSPQTDKYPLYKRMPRKLSRKVNKKLSDGTVLH